jgi:hypothetical protein
VFAVHASREASTPAQHLILTHSTISSLADSDIDQLYEKLKHHIGINSKGGTVEEMEKLVQGSNNSVSQIRDEMRASVATLTSRVDKVHLDLQKQNGVIVGIQFEAQHTVNDLATQFKDLQELVVSLMLPSTSSTRTTAHLEQDKI